MVKLTKNGVIRINFRNTPYNDFILKCNFKCSYCILEYMGMKQYNFNEKDFLQLKFIMDRLANIEDKIYLRMVFNGEVLINKWTRESASYISQLPNVKVVEIVTNNSVDPKSYLDRFNLTKTSFSCSFHPEFMSIQKFLKNMLILRKKGCNVYANMVCIPQIIKKIPKIFKLFREHNIILVLQTFRTANMKYLGRKFPQDYNFEERYILKKYFINMEEYDYLLGSKPTKGLSCYAGVDMFNLFLDGTIRRCFTGPISEKDRNNLHGNFWNKIPEKIRGRINSSVKNSIMRKLSRKITHLIRYETNIMDLISGKIKLQKEPYPCHENICACTSHLIGLKKIREKYSLAEKFACLYEIYK